MANLVESLNREDGVEAREILRPLVERIVAHDEDGEWRVEVRGELAAILGLAGASRGKPSTDADRLSEQ